MNVIELNDDRLTFGDFPPEPIRQAILKWFIKHNIDPNFVVVPGWVERDVVNYRIRWKAYVPNIATIPVEQIYFGGHIVMQELQLEARPFPFPSLDLSDYEPPGDDE